MLMTEDTPPACWQDRALAFLARARGQMWGRHKDEPMEWLYNAGLSVPFSQDRLLGWNFRPMRRDAASWMGKTPPGEKIEIAKGLVIPWMQGECIHRLAVVLETGESVTVTGSQSVPLPTGESKRLVLCGNDGDALRMEQECRNEARVGIAPEGAPLPEALLFDVTEIHLLLPDARLRDVARRLPQPIPVTRTASPASGILAERLSGSLTDADIRGLLPF